MTQRGTAQPPSEALGSVHHPPRPRWMESPGRLRHPTAVPPGPGRADAEAHLLNKQNVTDLLRDTGNTVTSTPRAQSLTTLNKVNTGEPEFIHEPVSVVYK